MLGKEFHKDNLHRITMLRPIISVGELKGSLRFFCNSGLQFSMASILLSSNPANLQFAIT
jgi:hypothetical protein